QHVHNIDVANWIKGSNPIKAEGTGGRMVRTGKDHGEIYDHHSIRFTYEDGTIINSECRHYPDADNRIDESFVGTKGKVYLNASNQGKIWSHDGKQLYNHDGTGNINPYQQEHNELFEAVSKGEFKYADAERTAKSTMTAILGRLATYSGKEITWDEAINSDLSLMPERLAWDALPKVLPNADGYYPHAIPGRTNVLSAIPSKT